MENYRIDGGLDGSGERGDGADGPRGYGPAPGELGGNAGGGGSPPGPAPPPEGDPATLITQELAALADDPTRITPDPAEVKALVDQIVAAIARLPRIEAHVQTWARTQARGQRPARPSQEARYVTGDR
jgi:hypothetical protein